MTQTILGLIGAIILLAIAFLPAVIAAAEENESVHFGEHLLILLAGVLLAYAVQPLIRHYLPGYLHRAGWGSGIAGLGLLLLVASQIPAVYAECVVWIRTSRCNASADLSKLSYSRRT